jgi:hypothetical protein
MSASTPELDVLAGGNRKSQWPAEPAEVLGASREKRLATTKMAI